MLVRPDSKSSLCISLYSISNWPEEHNPSSRQSIIEAVLRRNFQVGLGLRVRVTELQVLLKAPHTDSTVIRARYELNLCEVPVIFLDTRLRAASDL